MLPGPYQCRKRSGTVRINAQSNLDVIAARVAELGNRLPITTAVALTHTAKDVQAAIRAEMVRVFDRPQPYTLSSTFLKAATKNKLEARVWLKDNPSGKGTPADRYLQPQIDGGVRGQKGMERLLQARGLLRPGHVAVPAAGAVLDENGNVKRSQIIQILSQLKLQRGSGYESRKSNSAASRRTISRQGVTYFAIRDSSTGLKPGIYLKRTFAQGSAVRPVFIFVSKANYAPRLKFFEVGGDTARARFPAHFNLQADKTIAILQLNP